MELPKTKNEEASLGNVYVMAHSLFSDVVRIACTTEDPYEHVKSLSARTPGEYKVAYTQQCINPCKVKKRIQSHLTSQAYAKEFYQGFS